MKGVVSAEWRPGAGRGVGVCLGSDWFVTPEEFGCRGNKVPSVGWHSGRAIPGRRSRSDLLFLGTGDFRSRL